MDEDIPPPFDLPAARVVMLHIVGDAREQPAQLDRGRQLTTLNGDG
jgi:hypothetical protein